MITKEALENSIAEMQVLILKLEEAIDTAPAGSLLLKTYRDGRRVPFLSNGSRANRSVTRIDKDDPQLFDQMKNKAFARKALPEVKKALKALEAARGFETVNLYEIATQMGREFLPCADLFLGKTPRPTANPAFDELKERQNTYPFGNNAVYTDLGVFRSKSEGDEALIMQKYGIEFKYEPMILVGTKHINVDFVVNLFWKQEIGIIEHHGLLDDHKYRKKKMDNLNDMIHHGLYPTYNVLILSESARYGFDAGLAERLICAFCLPPPNWESIYQSR